MDQKCKFTDDKLITITDIHNYKELNTSINLSNNNISKLGFKKYKNQEIYISNNFDSKCSNVLLILSIFNGNDYIKLMLTIYELASVNRNIILIIPFLGYCRQHTKTDNFGLKLIYALKIFSIKKIYITEPHCKKLFLKRLKRSNIEIFSVRDIFARYIKESIITTLNTEDTILVSPDNGFKHEIIYYSKILNLKYAVGEKKRDNNAKVTELNIKVKKAFRNIIIIDDLIDTGSTITKLIDEIIKNGNTNISIFALCCHPVLSVKPKFLDYTCFKKLIVTNSIKSKIKSPKIEIINIYSDIYKSIKFE